MHIQLVSGDGSQMNGNEDTLLGSVVLTNVVTEYCWWW
jgi:hypothetical protein